MADFINYKRVTESWALKIIPAMTAGQGMENKSDKHSEALSADLVRHMADLSRLSLTEAEIEKFGRQFATILGYMAVLKKVDTSGVEPLYSCAFQKAGERRDEPDNRRSRGEILANAPETDGEYFIVPRII